MKRLGIFLLIVGFVSCMSTGVTMFSHVGRIPHGSFEDTLRYVYSLPSSKWPKALNETGRPLEELGVLPPSPLNLNDPETKAKIALGKTLFFDPRLSGSKKISCASCHKPELWFADARRVSIGHGDSLNKRNSPGLLNVWIYKKLFWDGRAKDLEDQAFFPINSESEMHSEMPEAAVAVRRIAGYKPLFTKAFGNAQVNPDRLAEALAVFQRSLVSNSSDFDKFLEGNKLALSNEALRGLHSFRTKAGCMQCHAGPLFTDGNFYNTGTSQWIGQKQDIGLEWVTKKESDRGKFKTPSLREVLNTGPWLHNGRAQDLKKLIAHFSNGGMSDSFVADTSVDKLLVKSALSEGEIQDLFAFLKAISAPAPAFQIPEMPK